MIRTARFGLSAALGCRSAIRVNEAPPPGKCLGGLGRPEETSLGLRSKATYCNRFSPKKELAAGRLNEVALHAQAHSQQRQGRSPQQPIDVRLLPQIFIV